MAMKFPISPWLFLVLLWPFLAETNGMTTGTLSSRQAPQIHEATTASKAQVATTTVHSVLSSLETSQAKTFPTSSAAPTTTISTTTAPRRSARFIQPTTNPRSVQTDNCTKPVHVDNQFDTPGLSGWVLTSHSSYFNSSASEHEHNLNCLWKIPKQEGLILVIRVSSLMLESAPTCAFDSLAFEYVELDSNNTVSRNFCGSADNKVLLAVSDVNITFKTDSSVSYRGFHLQWAFVNTSLAADIQNSSRSSLCTKLQEMPEATMFGLSAPGGRLVSHDEFTMDLSLPMHRGYRNNQNCMWTIALMKQYIILWIRFLQLESASSAVSMQRCNYDNLTLRFFDANLGQQVTNTLCSATRDRVYLANSEIEITFRTDSNIVSRGFDLEWLHLNESQASLAQQSWSSTAANSSQPDCTTPESMVNLTLNGVGGFSGGQLVSHPEYLSILSSNYRPDMNCLWTIRNPNNFTLIHFKVVSLDLETSSVRSSVCRFDNLTVKYRDTLTNRWMSKVACSSLHLAYFTSSSDVEVKFVTDRSVSRRGFHLMWFFIPRQEAYRLPGLENMQSMNCPEINDNEGTLQVDSYQQSINCRWQWIVNDGEVMNISVVYGDIDDQEGMQFIDEGLQSALCCSSRMPVLRMAFHDASGGFRQYCFCGRRTTGFQASIFQGPFSVTFRSEASVQALGFRLHYKRAEEPVHTNCLGLQVLSRYQSNLAGRLSRSRKTRCEWTVQPLDANHGIRVTMSELSLVRHYLTHASPSQQTFSGFDCTCQLNITTNSSISSETFRNWAIMINSNSSSKANLTIAPHRLTRCCGNSGYVHLRGITSLGPFSIIIDSARRRMQLMSEIIIYEINIQHFPIAKPGSSGLCMAQPTVTTKQYVVEQQQRSRLVSLKQVKLASRVDCKTSILMNTNQTMSAIIRGDYRIRVSINCTHSGGYVNVLNEALSVTTVNCSGGIFSGTLSQRPPVRLEVVGTVGAVTLEAVGTEGFTATLELVQLIADQGYICQQAYPTRFPWRAYLPLFSPSFGVQQFFYCTTELTPPPEHDLIVQLQMPFSNDYQEQFCSEISLLQEQPKLTFITSVLHSDSVMRLSLCDHNAPGGLRLQDRIRVNNGDSLTVDLTVSGLETRAQADQVANGFLGLLQSTGVDALIIVDQVEVCQRFPGSAEQWQISSDGAELVNSVTVVPGNTQKDCKLLLDAATVVGIANQSKALVPNAANGGCWNLRVAFDKFSTTCGMKQLMLTVSHWDTLAASVEHSQHEICGSSAISVRMHASVQAAGSGMSVLYSGVRSGFLARFSISACQVSELTTDEPKGVPRTSATASVAPSLTAVLIILALGNVFVILFAFRAKIFHFVQLFVSRTQRSHQLVYRPGGDGVNLIHEDM